MPREVNRGREAWRAVLFVLSVGLTPSILQTAADIVGAREWEMHAGTTWDFSLRLVTLASLIWIGLELLVAVFLFSRRTWGLFAFAATSALSLVLVFSSDLLRRGPEVAYVNAAVAIMSIVVVVRQLTRPSDPNRSGRRGQA